MLIRQRNTRDVSNPMRQLFALHPKRKWLHPYLHKKCVLNVLGLREKAAVTLCRMVLLFSSPVSTKEIPDVQRNLAASTGENQSRLVQKLDLRGCVPREVPSSDQA